MAILKAHLLSCLLFYYSYFKPPQEERLLPIGPSRPTVPSKTEAEAREDRVFEKFWQVLHNTPGASDTEKLIVEDKTEKVYDDLIANERPHTQIH